MWVVTVIWIFMLASLNWPVTGGFAEIIVYAQCMLFEVKVRVELPESRSFKRQKLLWFCAVQVHTCQEGYCPSGSKTTLYCGMQWTDCSSKVLPYLYLLEVIFLVYVLCFQCMLFLWEQFLRVLYSTLGARQCACRVLPSVCFRVPRFSMCTFSCVNHAVVSLI